MVDIERINALETKVEILMDREEIREVIYKYNHAIDRMDRELLFSCYHEDATTDHSPYYKGDIPGFVEMVMSGLYEHFTSTYYNTGNILIQLNGNKARCESYIFAPKILKPNDKFEPGAWLVAARFLDNFEKRDGEWRLAHRILVNEWEAFAPFEGTPAVPLDPSLPGHQPKRGRDDISYNF